METSLQAIRIALSPSVARERFLDRGAQNCKIVSTSGGLGPPDPPFLESTFLGAGHTVDLS